MLRGHCFVRFMTVLHGLVSKGLPILITSRTWLFDARRDGLSFACVLHIKPFFLSVDIRHTHSIRAGSSFLETHELCVVTKPWHRYIYIYIFRPIYYPPVNSRNSDPGSHSRLFFPIPATVRALNFFRENISVLCSLVDLRRTVLTHARRSQQLLSHFYFWK